MKKRNKMYLSFIKDFPFGYSDCYYKFWGVNNQALVKLFSSWPVVKERVHVALIEQGEIVFFLYHLYSPLFKTFTTTGICNTNKVF